VHEFVPPRADADAPARDRGGGHDCGSGRSACDLIQLIQFSLFLVANRLKDGGFLVWSFQFEDST